MPFIRKSYVITEHEQVSLSEGGETIGQQVDRAIASAMYRTRTGEGRMHEFTFGFETDEDWYSFMRAAQEQGFYPEESIDELARPAGKRRV